MPCSDRNLLSLRFVPRNRPGKRGQILKVAWIADKPMSAMEALKQGLLRRQPRERSFPNLQSEYDTSLCCVIIEQAVLDWIRLDYGRLGRMSGEGGSHYIYRAEVEAFFHSQWFETLLLFALPDYTPEDIRAALNIPEWTRN